MKPELDWINEARKHLGLKELNGSNKHPTIDGWSKNLGASWVIGQPWCGTYVAHCLKTAGVKYPKNWYRALAYASEGGVKLKKPAYGCVAVKSRNGGGHVCFVVGRDQKTNKLVCLGGNQSNMVCFALYAESDFDAFMWYGKTNTPAQNRYDLPILSGVTATKVTES